MMGRTAAITPGDQHGQPFGHLPASRENMELVSKLEMTEPFGDVAPGQIADVSVHKNAAYLASWSEPKNADRECTRGGFFSVDISDPANPKQLAFRPALELNYHGEGMHAISANTGAFRGDLLAVNNETCSTLANNADVPQGGGFDLYDVSDPADPKLLSRANGDYGGEGSLTGTDRIANEAHSVYLWQDGPKVYAVLVDNQEDTDVDIFDVSNPRSVQPVGDFDLDERFPQIKEDDVGQGVFPGIFLHDMVVKEIEGTQTMLASYWDAGYVTLNVDDPANPRYIADSDFGEQDPLTGFRPPEGNAHQAEFSHDNKHILAADEDFSQYRFVGRITGGPNSGFEFFQAGTPDEGPQISPDSPLRGDTRFIGEGCNAAAIPVASGGVTVAVAERGTCTFQAKTENAESRGYDAVIIFNNQGSGRCDALLNMDFSNYQGNALSLFVARSVGFRIIDAYDAATYSCNSAGTGTPAPAAPREGSPVDIGVLFDGWGYAHLYKNGTGKLEKRGDFAIGEGIDERYATDFGDLTIHEFATDPATNLAYSSYYSGGVRVLRYSDAGLEEMGHFIDEDGSNFWGVEQFTAANGERLIAASDRDYGLYVFRYTGPGAIGPRSTGGGPQPGSAGPKPGRCVNLLAVTAGAQLVGTAFGDQITGTAGQDVVDGAAGDDCIDGLAANDDLRGGAGVDTIDGQAGNDRIRGDAGRGNLRGGTGHDRISGGSSGDVLFGNTGRDRLSAGGGSDQLFGGAGADRLTGGKGRDVIEAGSGNDRIFAKDGKVDRIDCGFGRDTVASRDRRDKLTNCERRVRL